MKKILILLIAFSFSSCEKDDICDSNTSTTPRLIVKFYDIANPTTLKSVTKLRVTEESTGESIVFNAALPENDEARYLYTGNELSMPLNTNSDIVNYTLTTNFGVVASANEDHLTINYSREKVYVSRACGYKTIFKLNTPNGIVKTDATTPDGLWIQNITVAKTNIDNENETHVKIYF